VPERSALASEQRPLALAYCGYLATPCAGPDFAYLDFGTKFQRLPWLLAFRFSSCRSREMFHTRPGRLARVALLMIERTVAVSVGWIKCVLD
jgi:hypothetical protein